MKLKNVNGSNAALPDAHTVCEIIMRLSSSVHVMSWLMAETGCRLSDLQKMRVSDFSHSNGLINICTGHGCHHASLSDGLRDAIGDYLYQLREKFERYKRARIHGNRNKLHLLQTFSDQLLFPAWSIYRNEKDKLTEVFPAQLFIDELQAAAAAAGYTGMVHSNTLRLYCTSRWIEEGLNVAAIHERLGHNDVLTTMMIIQALRKEGLAFIPERGECSDAGVVRVA